MFQVKFLVDSSSLDTSSVAPLLFTVSKPSLTEPLTDLARGGECTRKKFTLTLLSSLGNMLKFQPIPFAENKVKEIQAF